MAFSREGWVVAHVRSEPGRCYFAVSSMMKKWFYLKKKRPPLRLLGLYKLASKPFLLSHKVLGTRHSLPGVYRCSGYRHSVALGPMCPGDVLLGGVRWQSRQHSIASGCTENGEVSISFHHFLALVHLHLKGILGESGNYFLDSPC